MEEAGPAANRRSPPPRAASTAAFAASDTRKRLRVMNAGLDPVRLLCDIRAARARRRDGSDQGRRGRRSRTQRVPFELANRVEEWRGPPNRQLQSEGAARPPPTRSADRCDGAVETVVRERATAHRTGTAREAADRAAGRLSRSLLRTVQRRLKIWRSEQALGLVFSGSSGSRAVTTAAAEPAMVDGPDRPGRRRERCGEATVSPAREHRLVRQYVR